MVSNPNQQGLGLGLRLCMLLCCVSLLLCYEGVAGKSSHFMQGCIGYQIHIILQYKVLTSIVQMLSRPYVLIAKVMLAK